jgi:hypothetical protein
MEIAYATDHTDAAPTARDHQTALRRQILAILPEIELFIIAFDCGLNPRSPRTKPALITWLLPHWREAEPHVFAFLDRAKHDPIREAWLGEGVDLPPVHPAETPEERARLLRKLTPRDRRSDQGGERVARLATSRTCQASENSGAFRRECGE